MAKKSIVNTPLHVKDIIRRVHSELIESQTERENNNEPPLFIVDKLTLEVNFTVTENTGVGGKFDLKVITADSAKTVEEQQVHKITLTLTANPNLSAVKDSDKPKQTRKKSPAETYKRSNPKSSVDLDENIRQGIRGGLPHIKPD